MPHHGCHTCYSSFHRQINCFPFMTHCIKADAFLHTTTSTLINTQTFPSDTSTQTPTCTQKYQTENSINVISPLFHSRLQRFVSLLKQKILGESRKGPFDLERTQFSTRVKDILKLSVDNSKNDIVSSLNQRPVRIKNEVLTMIRFILFFY